MTQPQDIDAESPPRLRVETGHDRLELGAGFDPVVQAEASLYWTGRTRLESRRDAYMAGSGPEDPLVDDNNPPPRLMDSPSVDTCLLFVRIILLSALLLVGIRLGKQDDVLFSQAAGFRLPRDRPSWSSRRSRETITSCCSHGRVVLARLARTSRQPPCGHDPFRHAGRVGRVAVRPTPLCRPNWPAGAGDHRLAAGRHGADGQGRVLGQPVSQRHRMLLPQSPPSRSAKRRSTSATL